MRVFFLFAAFAALGCGGGHRSPASAGAFVVEDMLTEQAELAEIPGKNQTLEQVRLASMALALGRDEVAEQALRRAVSAMSTFTADGEFAATVGAESDKEWKGEPYEKMNAFLTLGLLLYGKGDRDNALAMFKSAVLADTGTAEERYRSDFVPAWVMQALDFQAEGEPDNALQTMNRGIDALWGRTTLDLLDSALLNVRVPGDPSGVQAARAILLRALPGGVTAAPRDPDEAVRATLAWSTDLLKIERDRPKKERDPSLAELSAADFRAAAEAIPALGQAWAEAVAQLPPPALDAPRALAAQLEALLSAPPNVILLLERGDGPRKIRTGRYGEILQIVPGARPMTPPSVHIDDAPVEALWMDSLSWQATTRGGRKVDGFLKGKAIYKDASLITGYVLLRAAQAAAANDDSEVATVLACIGCALTVSSWATTPAADIRQWEQVPDGWYLIAGTWAPGEHRLRLDGRDRVLRVPERGQLVALLPATPPGGADVLGRE